MKRSILPGGIPMGYYQLNPTVIVQTGDIIVYKDHSQELISLQGVEDRPESQITVAYKLKRRPNTLGIYRAWTVDEREKHAFEKVRKLAQRGRHILIRLGNSTWESRPLKLNELTHDGDHFPDGVRLTTTGYRYSKEDYADQVYRPVRVVATHPQRTPAQKAFVKKAVKAAHESYARFAGTTTGRIAAKNPARTNLPKAAKYEHSPMEYTGFALFDKYGNMDWSTLNAYGVDMSTDWGSRKQYRVRIVPVLSPKKRK